MRDCVAPWEQAGWSRGSGDQVPLRSTEGVSRPSDPRGVAVCVWFLLVQHSAHRIILSTALLETMAWISAILRMLCRVGLLFPLLFSLPEEETAHACPLPQASAVYPPVGSDPADVGLAR